MKQCVEGAVICTTFAIKVRPQCGHCVLGQAGYDNFFFKEVLYIYNNTYQEYLLTAGQHSDTNLFIGSPHCCSYASLLSVVRNGGKK